MFKFIMAIMLISTVSFGADFTVQFSPEDNSISTVKLQDNSIATTKIQDGAVTAVKIADGSIDDSKVSSLSSSKISDLSTTMTNAIHNTSRKFHELYFAEPGTAANFESYNLIRFVTSKFIHSGTDTSLLSLVNNPSLPTRFTASRRLVVSLSARAGIDDGSSTGYLQVSWKNGSKAMIGSMIRSNGNPSTISTTFTMEPGEYFFIATPVGYVNSANMFLNIVAEAI